PQQQPTLGDRIPSAVGSAGLLALQQQSSLVSSAGGTTMPNGASPDSTSSEASSPAAGGNPHNPVSPPVATSTLTRGNPKLIRQGNSMDSSVTANSTGSKGKKAGGKGKVAANKKAAS